MERSVFGLQQVACVQKVLPPSSPAGRWQALKFITQVVVCAGGRNIGRKLGKRARWEKENWSQGWIGRCYSLNSQSAKNKHILQAQGIFFFFLYQPFLCCEAEGLCSSFSASPCSSTRLSSRFISLSYSTHSGTILAAAVSLGSLVLGLLHCGRKADKASLTPPEPLSPDKSDGHCQHCLWQHRNLIWFPIPLKGC